MQMRVEIEEVECAPPELATPLWHSVVAATVEFSAAELAAFVVAEEATPAEFWWKQSATSPSGVRVVSV